MKESGQRLAAVRAEMKKQGLDGFIVPRISEFQGEFIAPYAERLAWLTGFTGSAGTAIVLAEKAAILTDGRYTIQLAQQADKALYDFENVPDTSTVKWLGENVLSGNVIGYDPWLLTSKQVGQIEKSLTEKGSSFKAVSNVIDAVWTGRPAMPMEHAEIFPESFAGVSSIDKRKAAAKILKEKQLSACIISLPDSLAWLLNIRGHDDENTPVVFSFGILHDSGLVEWFVKPQKVTPEVKKHLGKDVAVLEPEKISERIAALKGKVGVDFARAPAWFRQALGEAAVDLKDPCIEPKAIKNETEQQSLRAAHIRDGAALVNFLAWLDSTKEKLDELKIVEKLEKFRRKDNAYRGQSFATISGWAANGAIVHYRATEETNAKIDPPGLLLLDSGGQYNDGTTDITRTIAIGKPTDEMKARFTLVLQGHIAVASAKFPAGTSGAQIDALARKALQAEGLDYSHGTGHGVGCFLSVHEESASISPRGTEALKPGMFLSNEPGYYKEGAYGIRTENLILVKEEGKTEEGEVLLGFETLSFVPIDRSLIVPELLSAQEKSWLNEYHAKVLKLIGPRVEPQARAWLERQAAPL